MKKQIIVEVSDDGSVRIETRGFKGETCLEESQFLKDLLGHETARQLTPAYYNRGRKIIKKHLPLCG
jgi:hypothetical protein